MEWSKLWNVVWGVIPFYVGILIGYLAVRRWDIFNRKHCEGMNNLNSFFVIPAYNFLILATTDMYKMNITFVVADTVGKFVILAILAMSVWASLRGHTFVRQFEWLVTTFMLATMPNTVIIGFPLMQAMYGEDSVTLVAQIVVVQAVMWIPLLHIMCEICESLHRSTGPQITTHVGGNKEVLPPDKNADGEMVASMQYDHTDVDSGFISMIGQPPLQNHTNAPEQNLVLPQNGDCCNWTGPTLSRIGLEQLKLNKGHVCKQEDENNVTAIPSNAATYGEQREKGRAAVTELTVIPAIPASSEHQICSGNQAQSQLQALGRSQSQSQNRNRADNDEEVMRHGRCVPAGSSDNTGGKRKSSSLAAAPQEESRVDRSLVEVKVETVEWLPASDSKTPPQQKTTKSNSEQQQQHWSEMRKLLKVAGKIFLQGHLMWSGVLGLTYGLLASRYGFEMPTALQKTLVMLSSMCLGLSMVSLGIFTAYQESMIPIGWRNTAWTFFLRLFWGPAVVGLITYAFGCRGQVLKVAIMQSSLPQAIVTFVFSSKYAIHSDIFSTGVCLGTLVSLPLLIVYYILLETIM